MLQTLEKPLKEIEKTPTTIQIAQTHIRKFLAGKSIPWAGPLIEVDAPFKINGSKIILGSYPDLGPEEGKLALSAASKAYNNGLGQWPQSSPEVRIAAVEEFLSLLDRDKIAQGIMLETAKIKPDAYKEFDRTIEYIKDTIDAYRKMLDEYGKVENHPDGAKSYMDATPYGVTLCMGPYNYPFNETMQVLIPALLTGNTIIMKPARFGVLFNEHIADAFEQSFPEGVVNVIYGGPNVIKPIMESGEVKYLAFVGSTKVSNLVTASHPPDQQHNLRKVTGLSSHNYGITLADSNLDNILPETMKGLLGNGGMRCTTIALSFVQEDLADEYAERVANEVSKLKVGLPWEEGVSISNLVEGQQKIEYLQSLIDDAVAKGARVMNPRGGELIDYNLMVPAVLYPVTPDMKAYHSEQFGPVVPIAKFKEPEEVVRQLAESRFGQQISLFGSKQEELAAIAMRVKTLVGRVNINTQCQRGPDSLPFGGKKDSGIGVLSITEALKTFTYPTVIYVKN